MKVSANGRYLVDRDGKPFFYLADTAWRLFYETDRQEAEDYLIKQKPEDQVIRMRKPKRYCPAGTRCFGSISEDQAMLPPIPAMRPSR